jgi:hypothetical protein
MPRLRGLCHSCLGGDLDLIVHKGQILCMNCYHKRFSSSPQNDPPATMKDLKSKWEKK